jgi:hypothetical protein
MMAMSLAGNGWECDAHFAPVKSCPFLLNWMGISEHVRIILFEDVYLLSHMGIWFNCIYIHIYVIYIYIYIHIYLYIIGLLKSN